MSATNKIDGKIFNRDYSDVPEWTFKDTGYQAGDMVKYKGNIFIADYWAQAAPGEKPKPEEGWRLYDVIYNGIPSNSGPSKVIGYLPSWKKSTYPFDRYSTYKSITHALIAFLTFSMTTMGAFDPASLADVSSMIPIVKKYSAKYDVKVMISLGGGNDFAFKNLMTEINTNENHPLLLQTAKAVVDFVKSNGLDGVDLDMECWWDPNGDPNKDEGGRMRKDGPHPAGHGLTLFAKKLRQMMPNALIAVAFPGTSWYGNNLDPSIHQYLDWIGLMTYDLTGSWRNSPVGPHSKLEMIRDQSIFVDQQQGKWQGGGMINNPIFSAEECFWYWSNPFYSNWQGDGARVPAEKLLLGVPLYGYDFAYGNDPGNGQGSTSYKAITYKEIQDLLRSGVPLNRNYQTDNIFSYGSTPRPSFIKEGGSYPFTHNIYYESKESAVKKIQFCKKVRCQGVIVWEVAQDADGSDSILDALFDASGSVRPIFIQFGANPTASWMRKLPDETLISDIVIPGTHDSGACRGLIFASMWGGVITQDKCITDQLKGGIRFLDIRLGLTPFHALHQQPRKAKLYHGFVDLSLDFSKVLFEIAKFLDQNPSETVFMRMKKEREENDKDMTTIITKELKAYDKYIWRRSSSPDSTLPTKIGNIRGKIIVLTQDISLAYYGTSYGFVDKHDVYEFTSYDEAVKELVPRLIGSPDFQRSENKYLYEAPTSGFYKVAEIQKFAKDFNYINQLVLNEFSKLLGYSEYPAFHPDEILRSLIYEYITPYLEQIRARKNALNKKPKGIISMDFPSDNQISSIIAFNF